VRAKALSPDGLRGVVGLEEGFVRIFSYNDFVPDNDNDNDSRVHHPFVMKKDSNDGDDVAGGLLQLTQGGTKDFDGPHVDAAVRQLALDPCCGSKEGGPYYLAVASEDGNRPLVICDVGDGDGCLIKKLYWRRRGSTGTTGEG